ncbi:fibronectin type III domain-containing protein 9 [Entelurus aequoreus]|uniref:fibronectin type III domain-containing protein 9 n=1 Tax=Entelurus aequoreus TaxID=161455 RepID=UPI002B1D6EFF|nr:fibronectin type III domain-containing protein 9 [Entelurus aequoreus]XP_061894761.1 fibronectin type III domain-containing protein 9 [Entelurus aequoreus]
MAITVYDVSSTCAQVSWPAAPGCLDSFYSVMYHPEWSSLLLGFKRKSFMHEERIPVSQTSTRLANLLPHTAYFLCVTCQAADPVRDQCQVFVTLSDGEGQDRAGWESGVGVWLTCCVLLLVAAAALLWGCRHNGRAVPARGVDDHTAATDAVGEDGPASGRLYTKQGAVMRTPLLANRDLELRTLAKMSASELA